MVVLGKTITLRTPYSVITGSSFTGAFPVPYIFFLNYFLLFQAFGEQTEYGSFCLAHLFTAESMPSSVLGLAYIASSRVNTAGGICSPSKFY